MGRAARGVRGISVREGDRVVDMVIASPEETILSVTKNGYGKRTELVEYRLQNRGGKGIINIRTTDRNGPVVNLLSVRPDDDVMMITQNGMSVRTPVAGISVIGRATQGVRLISLYVGDTLVACAKVAEEGEEGVGVGDRDGGGDPPTPAAQDPVVGESDEPDDESGDPVVDEDE
jgi:DNA gyrase subunit A